MAAARRSRPILAHPSQHGSTSTASCESARFSTQPLAAAEGGAAECDNGPATGYEYNNSPEPSGRSRSGPNIAELTRRLLSNKQSSSATDRRRGFEQLLDEARSNKKLLRSIQLPLEEASEVFLLPPDLLKDVHAAILYFSRKQNFGGMSLELSAERKDDEASSGGKAAPLFTKRKEKVPGPILCAKLLELIGLPHHYQHIIASSSNASAPSSDPPKLVVHSSQVDFILESCLETAIALSRSCEVGRHSLIAANFHLRDDDSGAAGGRKHAAQLTEEIFRCIWNTRIRYTSGKRTTMPRNVPWQMRVGRVGSIGMGPSPMEEYLPSTDAALNEANGEDEIMVGMATEADARTLPWTAKDQRRYDKAVVLFNSVLAAYAKLSSSASGIRHELRREMVQNAERLLLEVASHRDAAHEASPSTVLQCLKPDAVSFNTAIKAWCDFSPKAPAKKVRGRGFDNDDVEESACLATAAAERTESILTMMQDLHDEERAAHATALRSVRAAWGEHGTNGHDRHAPPRGRAIAPVAGSYNGVIRAWSRSPDPEAPLRALRVYRTMMERNNGACLARNSLLMEDATQVEKRSRGDAGDALPDSRTLVVLLQALQGLSRSIGFRDRLDTVESIFRSAKDLDEQMRWSKENGIAPTSYAGPILNVFSYNTLIKTLSKMPTTWEENLQCCLRIDELVEELKHSTSEQIDIAQVLPNVITSWAKCGELAGDDRQRSRICAEKVEDHLDALLTDFERSEGGHDGSGKYLVQAINDAIALYGRAELPAKADELFSRAKACNLRNLATLSAVIDALCQSGDEDIAHVERAHQYLLGFEQDKMRMNGSFVIPDMRYTSMYNSVISGYLNCDMKNRGLQHAQRVLAHMVASHESNPRHIARPNTTSFVTVMAAMAQRGDHIRDLEELLGKMEAMHQRLKGMPQSSPDADLLANVTPNIVVYNLMLKAYARKDDSDSVQSAMKLLGRIEKDPTLELDEVSNSYILALMTGRDGADKDAIASTSGEEKELVGTKLNADDLSISELNLNGRKLEPTVKSFDSIMNVYATTGTVEGAEKGAALLHKLEAMHRSGEISAKPDIFLYNKLMNAWQLCEQTNTDPSISPSERAQEILDSICDQCEEGGDGALSPNDVSFSICIHSWCKSSQPDAAERAEQLLRRKEAFAEKHRAVQVKGSDYNPIIAKWKDDPERATLFFEEMLQRYGDTEPWTRPTAATLNALLDVYAKYEERNLAIKADNVLRRINRLHKEGKCCIAPDVISYRTVMDAWIRQWHKDSPQRVDALVKDMIDKYENEGRSDLCPDSNALNLVLKACSQAPSMWKEKTATPEGSEHPIAIANRVFSALKGKKYGATATHATYSFMFMCYRQHMNFRDKRYASLMQNLWKHCCRDGLVSNFTLRAFRDSVLEDDFWEAIGGKDKFERLGKTKAERITVKDLPKEWNTNVIPLKDRGKRKAE